MQKPNLPYSTVRGRPLSKNYSQIAGTLPSLSIPLSSSTSSGASFMSMPFSTSPTATSSATSSPTDDGTTTTGTRLVLTSEHHKKLMGLQAGRGLSSMIARLIPPSTFLVVAATLFFGFTLFFLSNLDSYLLSSTTRKASTMRYRSPMYNSSSSLSPDILTSTSTSTSSSSKLVPANIFNSSSSSNNNAVNNNNHQYESTYVTSSSRSIPASDVDDNKKNNNEELAAHGLNVPPDEATGIQPPHTEKKTSLPVDATKINYSNIGNKQSSAVVNKRSTPTVDEYGKVGWNRSWPLTEQHDDTQLYRIATTLKFTNQTLLDYFHLHKTGGVSIKAAIIELIDRAENHQKLTKRGQRLRHIETCYQADSPLAGVSVREVNWRCDFRKIREMSTSELRSYDVVLGHQYWETGSQYYFGTFRDVRYFSILRHPLSRKLSFYYHFFVRNAGAKEKDISREEVLDFVFGQSYDGDARMRDGGINYYASRFMSNGMSLFIDNQYRPGKNEEDEIIERITSYLDDRFVFVGLQTQNTATNCMMEKTMQVFAHAHGVDTLVGSTLISEETRKPLNTGNYPWTAKKLWLSMSPQEKARFRQVERIDLAVYKKAVERFRESVRLFGCEHSVDEAGFEEDRFD